MNKSILIFDYETNDFLHHEKFQVIQYAFKVIKGINDITTYTGFVKSNGHMSRGAQDTHGFSKVHINHHGIEIEEFNELVNNIFSEDYAVIVGHNILGFDIPATEKVLKINFPIKTVFDTAGEAKAIKLAKPRGHREPVWQYHKRVLSIRAKGVKFNLPLCLEENGITPSTIGKAHNALVDVENTEQLFLKQAVNYEKLYNLLKNYYEF